MKILSTSCLYVFFVYKSKQASMHECIQYYFKEIHSFSRFLHSSNLIKTALGCNNFNQEENEEKIQVEKDEKSSLNESNLMQFNSTKGLHVVFVFVVLSLPLYTKYSRVRCDADARGKKIKKLHYSINPNMLVG